MTFKIITFGCRLNSYESEVIKGFFKEKSLTDNKDIVVFNSCAVTQEAERQLGQAIRKSKKENPQSTIVVVGCAAQMHPEKYLAMPEVSFILGNDDKLAAENYLRQESKVSNVFECREIKKHLIDSFEGRSRAFVRIQTGCNNHCTFCLTRLARGYSRSLPPEAVLEQINLLVANGYREIVLTGIDISDYGRHFEKKINLGLLLQKIFKETKVERIRLSSLDIADMNEDLLEVITSEKRFMPHIHLSLQSGDNEVLRLMARRHTREQTLKVCNYISSKRNIVFGADLIAGFPMETEEAHQNSINLAKEIPIVCGHIFPYSVRPNTIAAQYEQLNKSIRKQRATELREEVNHNLQALKTSLEGTKHMALVETDEIARLDNYLTIKGDFKGKVGDVVEVIVRQKTMGDDLALNNL